MENSFKYNTNESIALEEKFGYRTFYDYYPIEGWLMNCCLKKDRDDNLDIHLYFVEENGEKFKLKIKFYPSCTLETLDNFVVEEYLLRKYSQCINKIEAVKKYDCEEYNYINNGPKDMLRVFMNIESDLKTFIRDIREIIFDNRSRESEVLDDFNEYENYDAKYFIKKLHEYDVPHETQAMIDLNLRCGSWYRISYDGSGYDFDKMERSKKPALKILAYDIETAKSQLRFPNDSKDPVMMISVMCDTTGYLIVNRNAISCDINNFNYFPTDDIGSKFVVFNEKDEENLLVRFVKIVQEYAPHIITTYNGGFFDFRYIDKRLQKYKISFYDLTGYSGNKEYFNCSFMIHLDCYKWVKRDSSLSLMSQGLKMVCRLRLNYEPEDIDPEDLMRCAIEEPFRLAKYSVSDSVATYYLYIKFVQDHVFSMAQLLPMNMVSVLIESMSCLIESLLVSQASTYNVLIKSKKITNDIEFHKDRFVYSKKIVFEEFETVNPGIFRADFKHKFSNNDRLIDLIIGELDEILIDYKNYTDYNLVKNLLIDDLRRCKGSYDDFGNIYRLSFDCMYPNIILTNNIQPHAIITGNTHDRCDFNSGNSNCNKKMNWLCELECYPIGKTQFLKLGKNLDQEIFYSYDNNKEARVKFDDLSDSRKLAIVKPKLTSIPGVREFKNKIKETSLETVSVCQKVIPFFIDTIKSLNNSNKNRKNKHLIDNETGYKEENTPEECLFDSFYTYLNNEDCRWYSMESVGCILYFANQIINLAKNFIQKVGILLDVDSEGMWIVMPRNFPVDFEINGQSVDFLSMLLNYFVCNKFTNYQYKESLNGNLIKSEQINTMKFVKSVPYKMIVVPSNLTNVKKRYVVFDFNDRLVDLKGFMLSRKNELKYISKFHGAMFEKIVKGTSIEEVYLGLVDIIKYWNEFINLKGYGVSEDKILELFSETKTMNKEYPDCDSGKSNVVSAATKLSEFFNINVPVDKIKCEYFVSKYPVESCVADRVIPNLVYKSERKEYFLNKWLGNIDSYDLKDIIDWSYYNKRFENNVERLVTGPAVNQGIKSVVDEIRSLKWNNSIKQLELFRKGKFKYTSSKQTDVENVFYTSKKLKKSLNNNGIVDDRVIPSENENVNKTDYNLTLHEFILKYKDQWIRHYNKRIAGVENIYEVSSVKDELIITLFNKSVKRKDFTRKLYLQVNDEKYYEMFKSEFKFLPNITEKFKMFKIEKKASEFEMYVKDNLKTHFSVKGFHLLDEKLFELLLPVESYCSNLPFSIVTSVYNKSNTSYQVSFEMLKSETLKLSSIHTINQKILVMASSDPNLSKIREVIKEKLVIDLDVPYVQATEYENVYQKDLHRKLHNKYVELRFLSNLTNCPLKNLINMESSNGIHTIIDFLFIKTLMNENVIPIRYNSKFTNIIYQKEYNKPYYYPTYCIQFHCVYSLILSIIDNNLSIDVNRKDFKVIQILLKDLIYKAFVEDCKGARLVLENFAEWVLKKSCYLPDQLRQYIISIHDKYITNLVKDLKSKQVKVISVSKNMVFVDSGQRTYDECIDYFKYIKEIVSQISGCEMLKLKPLKIMEKVAFIDSSLYFYVFEKEILSVTDAYNIPLEFFEMYFSDKIIDNEFVYSQVQKMTIESMKLILRFLSYKRDIHGLASNCYKLMKTNEFEEENGYRPLLSVFCSYCKFENIIRKRCINCLKTIDKRVIELECINYLRYCYKQHFNGDRRCNRCDSYEVRKLKEYCSCGGKYVLKNFTEEINDLKAFVDTKRFNEEVSKVVEFIGNSDE